jgi:hypothetical protein
MRNPLGISSSSLSGEYKVTYSTSPDSIEDFDTLVECWGVTHALDDYSKRSVGRDRTLYTYEFECGRMYVTEYQNRRPMFIQPTEKPKNSCPGCCPTMNEITKW